MPRKTRPRSTAKSSRLPKVPASWLVLIGLLLVLVCGMLIGSFQERRAASHSKSAAKVSPSPKIRRLAIPTPTPVYIPPLTKAQTIGNFVFTPPENYVVAEVYGEPVAIRVSNYNATKEPNCDRVSGIYNFFSRRVSSMEPTMAPSFHIVSFDEQQLTFPDEAARQSFNTYLDQLALLEKVGIEPMLPIMSRSEIYKKLQLQIGNFISCGGAWSYPLLLQKIDQPKFDQVFYGEFNRGNGDYAQPPQRALFVNQGSNWAVVTEDYSDSFDHPILDACLDLQINDATTDQNLECVDKAWRENYRSEAANKVWIERVIQSLRLR
jgi:hypothetical protein